MCIRDSVERMFPLISIEGKDGVTMIDCEKIEYPKWDQPLNWSEISTCALNDNNLDITTECRGTLRIKFSRFASKRQKEVLIAFQNYHGRYLAAKNYQKNLRDSQVKCEDAA